MNSWVDGLATCYVQYAKQILGYNLCDPTINFIVVNYSIREWSTSKFIETMNTEQTIRSSPLFWHFCKKAIHIKWLARYVRLRLITFSKVIYLRYTCSEKRYILTINITQSMTRYVWLVFTLSHIFRLNSKGWKNRLILR